MIAFLGMGLLGSNFVQALLKKGEKVQIWNRTTAKAKELEVYGAVAFDHVTDAVRGVRRIHVTLVDDKVVDEVLKMAQDAIDPGTTIIDHTTTSVDGAIARTQYWKDRGVTYLHAPVFMGPVNALAGSGHMLVSGDQDVLAQWLPALSAMTGTVINFGPVTGRAAGMKLAGNLFLLTLTGGIADTLSLAKSMDIPAAEVLSLFNEWNPGAFVPARMKRIITADFDHASWELQMARKDARLMMEETGESASLKLIPVIAAEMDRFLRQGNAEKDWTIIASDAL